MSAAILTFTDGSANLSPAELAQVQGTLTAVVESLREKRGIERKTRAYLNRIIAELIDIVDSLDGDPDLEDDADLEIAWCESAGRGPTGLMPFGTTDDDEDSDPATAFDDDTGLGDADGRDEQDADRHRSRRT